jgi:hypothetical protein
MEDEGPIPEDVLDDLERIDAGDIPVDQDASSVFDFFKPVPEGTVKRWHVLEGIIKSHDVIHCAEIGVKSGRNIAELLLRCPDTDWLAVDPWTRTGGYSHWSSGQVRRNEQQFDDVMSHHPGKIKKLKMTSRQAEVYVADSSLDLVFIDGDHSYEAVKEDIALWTPKVREGGIIAGHDYANKDKYGTKFDGVERAVKEALADGVFGEQEVNLEEDHVWWVVKT